MIHALVGILTSLAFLPTGQHKWRGTPSAPTVLKYARDATPLRLQRADREGGYQVVFPGTKYAPVFLSSGSVNIFNRAVAAPGITVSISHQERAKNSRTGPRLMVNGRPELGFEEFYRAPSYVAEAVVVDFGPGYYRFYGLAKAHGKVYLCVAWYADGPTLSGGQVPTHGVVVRLDPRGRSVRTVLVKRVNTFANEVGPPRLDVLSNGDLLLQTGHDPSRSPTEPGYGLVRMDRSGKWHRLSGEIGKRYQEIEGMSCFSWRETWLIAEPRATSVPLEKEQGSLGNSRERHSAALVVFDGKSRRKLCEFRWSYTLQ